MHPETLMSVDNLAGLLGVLGRGDEAAVIKAKYGA